MRIQKDSKKRFFIDLETSGLEPSQGAVILQIGCLTDDPEDGEFSMTILPTNEEYMKASPKAIEVNGLTWETLQEKGKPYSEVKEEFLRYLSRCGIEGCVLIGQNPTFDMKFLKYFMKDELDYLGVPYQRPVDVRSMYSEAIRRGKVKPISDDRRGHTISRTLGVKEEPKVHDALEGAKVVKRNYDKLKELLSESPRLA